MPKILDCTLRDGGYINNWDFSLESAKDIIRLLKLSNADFVEIGFYQHNLNRIIPNDCSDILAMVEYSKTPIEKILPLDNSKIKGLRVIFKKHENHGALLYCNEIKNKGYKLFINATFINQYNDFELACLIKRINKIKPYAFTVTDSIGTFTSVDIKRVFKIIQSELNPDISLCFHSHNNLGLSFSNAKTLIDLAENKREIIIDSTAFGMGRGAGNLHSETIMEYLNQNGARYNLKPIFEIIKKYIMPIYQKTPWGCTIPYYLSALYECHPNYAKDLIEKKIELKKMDEIFSSIPYDKKSVYDNKLISEKFV